ncbi:hypothetical protein K9N50_10165 [bacterium]|nr:hypothetical protein [bacterium]
MNQNHRKIQELVLIVAVLSFSILLTNCAHNKKSTTIEDLGDYEIIPIRVLAAIDSGNRIAVIDLRGAQFVGILNGIELQPVAEYEERYQHFRSVSRDSQLLPTIGENTMVTLYPEREYNGIFIGFDYGSPGVICLKDINGESIIRIKLEDVRSVKMSSEIVEGRYLNKLAEARGIPYRSVISMQIEDTEFKIPMNQVRQIKIYQTKSRWTGMLLNFVIVIGLSILTSALVTWLG